MNEADHTPYSLARILNTNDLIDTMATAYDGYPPMTYFGAGKQPTSRIDLLCTKNMGPFVAATAEGPAGISATHAALSIAFTDDEIHKTKNQDRTNEDSIDHVVAYMTECGGRSWSLNEKSTKEYTALCSKDSGSETRKRIEELVRKHATGTTTTGVPTPDLGEEEDNDQNKEKNLEICHEEITFYDDLVAAILHGEATVKARNLKDGHAPHTEKRKTGNIDAYTIAKNALEALKLTQTTQLQVINTQN